MSIYDKTGHIDQLTEWWENAEEGVIEKGDTVINRSDSVTTVYVATVRTSHRHPNARILSRAPKPKPAWHDSVAVIATVPNEYGEDERGVWVPGASGMWEDDLGRMFDSGDLRDVTPLIEAKVTDEMVERGRDIGVKGRKPDAELVRRILATALGLETE